MNCGNIYILEQVKFQKFPLTRTKSGEQRPRKITIECSQTCSARVPGPITMVGFG